MDKKPKYNPQIHHRRSIRLKGYDYAQAGLYFITICCQDRACLFGRVTNGHMVLNDAGLHADACWVAIPEHFPHAVLHAHIVMPNHVHGIVELIDLGGNNVGAKNFSPLRSPSRTIGSIVRGFKIGVTKWFRQNKPDEFTPERAVWQRNYYEHIIRNEQSYHTISEYIINNPVKWEDDKFYTL